MELGDFLSPLASLVVGFVGALFGVRQANAAWQRDQNDKRTMALRNYERALYDMALYLEGIESPELEGHPWPDDVEEKRRAAFPYFGEFERVDYFKLLAPATGPDSTPGEASDIYADVSKIIKTKLDAERRSLNGPSLGSNRVLRRFIKRGKTPPGSAEA